MYWILLLLAVAAICWNCRIHPGLLVLITLLALGIVGSEGFTEIMVSSRQLTAAMTRPSFFQRVNQIGETPMEYGLL